jgi:ABC-type multidrug transport system fused ATPase/permease subunit
MFSFRYTATEQVEAFSATIQLAKPGIGRSYWGRKSSLGKFITVLRFQGGQLLVDDQDIRTFDLHSYRCRGIATNALPVRGTVADNIRYGKPSASDDEVVAVAPT